MKHLLLTTIAAALVVGCEKAPPPDISIHDAAAWGNIEAVKQHIAAGTDVNTKNHRGQTPLHFAAGEGHKEVTELLIANGADVNAKAEEGWTPLHHVAEAGHTKLVELLIAKGADVSAKTDGGSTPLDKAIQGHRDSQGDHQLGFEDYQETADLLRKHGAKESN